MPSKTVDVFVKDELLTLYSVELEERDGDIPDAEFIGAAKTLLSRSGYSESMRSTTVANGSWSVVIAFCTPIATVSAEERFFGSYAPRPDREEHLRRMLNGCLQLRSPAVHP
jgi:hypothetical protein